MMRLGIVLVSMTLMLSSALANEGKYIINFDLNTKLPDGSVGYSIRQQGMHVSSDQPFHGSDLGSYDYFLTVSDVADGKGKLTIEFYEYQSRNKESDVISEIVAEVSFELGRPAVYEGKSDTFGIDLAFSIEREKLTPTDLSH